MQKKMVLVVDDDADMRVQVKTILQPHYRVVTAESGKECLQSVARARPDCVVMDVMMDGLADGLEAAKKIKESPETREIPIILLTSVNESYDYRSQVDAGYFPHNCWMDKPVKAERLLKEIAALVGT